MTRIITAILVVVVVALFAVFVLRNYFGLFRDALPSLNIDIRAITPDSWQPGPGGLEDINIDGDPDIEYALFYTYDGGLWGGVIYDGQNQPRGDPNVTAPNQAPAYLVPYRLLPDYVSSKPSDYLGNDRVAWQDVYVRSDGDKAAPLTVSRDRIQVRGDFRGRTTRFSAFWWLEDPRGYGGATTSTPGWFSLSRDKPDQWAAWAEEKPIIQLWAWEPLESRSNICRRVPVTLAGGEQVTPPGGFARNDAVADLSFCSGDVPADPAYPEAQVLAWLLQPADNRLSSSAMNVPRYTGAQVQRLSTPADLSTQKDGRIVASGEVDFIADNLARRMQWSAEMLSPASIRDQVHWRILRLVPR